MNERTREKIFHAFTLAILVIIALGGAAMAYPRWMTSRALKAKQASICERKEATKREIAQLVENQKRFREDAHFIERVARGNHRVFPGELVFTFDD